MKIRVFPMGAILGIVAVIIAAAQPSPSLAETSGDAMYIALAQRAESGDQRSKAMVDALDRYLAANNLKVAELGSARNEVTIVQRGPVALRIRDFSPWVITVENVSTFSRES